MGKKENIKNIWGKVIPFLGLLVAFILFSATTNGRFLLFSNMKTILLQSVITMIAGVGVSFVMAHGNLDFSIGGEMALAAVAAYFAGQVNPVLCLPAAMLVGAACGLFSAWANAVVGIPAFIAGMCIMFIGRGLSLGMSMTVKMTTPLSLVSLDKPIFYITILIVVLAAGYILMEHTVIGKFNKAIGSNDTAAHFSGVSVGRYKAYAFMISGACMGICALLSMLQGRSVTANTGLNVEINTLIALMLGGLPLAGGTTVSLRSAVVGALTFYILYNGLILWGLTPDMIGIVKAVVFLVCVYLSFDRKSGIIPS
ncbi:MAG: ABC transporter permease [Muricomes sp.]|uniref:ABC transporter permease n=1 Tax=Faecalicatena contorta TaxID=39482 RepID=UPI002ECF7F2A|nr:ABC transporter permease [Muricomes sp.]